jgi:galacturonosyltransferase
MNIVMITNDTNFAWHLRREILAEFVRLGHKATLIARIMDFEKEFNSIGVRVIDVENDRRGTNPLADFHLFQSYRRILKNEKPDIVFTNNIKPNVYAGLACQFLRIKYIPNITGLGTPVENPGPLQHVSTILYRLGVRKASAIFFQNTENQSFFSAHKLLRKGTREVLLPGSGVNLESFPLLPWPTEHPKHILFAARILREKGIDLFLAAARRFASRDEIIFDVCGQCDDQSYLQILENDSSIAYHGLQKNLKPWYEKSCLFLYPSYYPEGMSNVLLEAAASGRPVIAADRSGCREIVDDGKTGFIVPIKDEKAVINAVSSFLDMEPRERKQMGLLGRVKMEKEFSRTRVVEKYCEEIERLFPDCSF